MRKKNFVVGYAGERQCVYGKNDFGENSWTNPLTFLQAKKEVKELRTPLGNGKISKGKIFKLVEVK